jgi:hypothetical protein
MEVYIHKDAHIASIATSLFRYEFADNPMGELRPNQLADILKRENVRSYNYAHGRRMKINLCATIDAIMLSTGELLQATKRLELQIGEREDYPSSEAAKMIKGIYDFLPPFLNGYEEISVSGVTAADALKSFASHDDGTGLHAWHWDDDWKTFEKSSSVNPGRIKPYPWLIRQLLGEDGLKFKFANAEVKDPLAITKYLRECLTLPDTESATKIHQALLRHHLFAVPEVASASVSDIGMDDEADE